MALQVDGSSPAVVRGATTTTTTGSFSPPASSLLVAFCHGDANNGSTDEALTISSTGGLSWSLVLRHNGSPGATVEVWKAAAASAPGSITVSATDNKGAVDKSLFVRVFTDSAGGTPDTGATNSNASTTCAYTSTVNNSWGWGLGMGGGTGLAAGSGQTLQDSLDNGAFDGGDSIWTEDQNSTTATAGTTVTMSITIGTGPIHHIAGEIIPGSGAGLAAGQSSLPPVLLYQLVAAVQAQRSTTVSGQTFSQSLDGTTTSAGSLTNLDAKPLAGTATSSSALTKADSKALAGTVTSSGALAKQDQKSLAGTVTSAGALAKLVLKSLTGTITSSGVLTTIKVVLRSFAGTVTSSGALTKQAAKALTGASTPAGVLARATSRALAGLVSAAGALAKLVAKPFAGSATPTGSETAAPIGQTANATSTPTLAATHTSSSTAAAGPTSTAAVGQPVTSTPAVSAGRTSTNAVNGSRTSTPSVSDG